MHWTKLYPIYFVQTVKSELNESTYRKIVEIDDRLKINKENKPTKTESSDCEILERASQLKNCCSALKAYSLFRHLHAARRKPTAEQPSDEAMFSFTNFTQGSA